MTSLYVIFFIVRILLLYIVSNAQIYSVTFYFIESLAISYYIHIYIQESKLFFKNAFNMY